MSTTIHRPIQHGLALELPLKSPTQMPALLTWINTVKDKLIFPELARLHDVHFARFLMSGDHSALWVITTYDGRLEDYIMDFVAVIGDAFTEILTYIAGAPPLPVSRYPREFVDFINAHNRDMGVWSAYPDVTVIEIQDALEATT
jgi:hypothetical protein